MPNPKQVMENPQQKKKVKFYHVQEEEAEQLYQGSLQETYRHNMKQSRFYKKKAREKNQIPPDNGSFSGFKKIFKALGRFLTGTPNYYELYNKIDSRWEAYNLDEVSHNLEEGSNHILEENSLQDPMTPTVTLQKAGVYQAFTNMAEHGEFFDAEEGDKVLMNLQGDAFSFEEENTQLSDKEKQALRDASAAREDLARFLEQLKQFKEAHGKLSPENLSKLRSTYLEKKEGSQFSPCGKYIFELVTGVQANKESLDYASKNHPDLLQMIIYTQILNQMDLAINQMLIPKQLGQDSVLLNLEQYAHLQAQKKETNRLLTELMNKSDIRTEFKNKFENDAQKDALKDKNKEAGAKKTSEKNKEGNEQEGQEANLSTDKKFMTLYAEYSKLAGDNKDAKKQFLIKNLKTLLAAAAEISKNQSNEEKADENGVVAPLSVIKDTVSKIANDPFAYDYFAVNMTDFDQLMNATACMIPDSEVSKTMDKAELVKKINNFYPSSYNLVKQDLANHFVSNLEDAEVVEVKDDKEQKYHSIMLEFYDGFHSKKLEKYNPLFSVVKEISYDPKAYKALLDAPIAKEEFKSIRNLISTDYALHILEGQQLQKDQYYKNLERAAQELDRSLPVLKTWYKKYTEDLAQKEKEAVTASLKEQIKDFSNPGAPQDEKTDAGKQDSAKDKVKENASDKTKKFLDTVKEFIAKNPVNDKDENAEIYSRIYETLTNPQIEVVMKQPDALQDVLNLSSFILEGNQAVTDLAYTSYSTLTQALQAEQEQREEKLRQDVKGTVSKEKALERITDQIEILKKKAKNPNSVLNTQKLIDSLTAYIENHLVIEKYSVVEKYVEGEKEKKHIIKKQVSKEELLNGLKDSPKFISHPETLNQLLDFADSIKKDQSQTAPKAFAQSWAITKEALVKEQKEQKEHKTSEKISKKINKIKVKKLNNLKETKEKIKIIKEIKEIKKQEEQERRNAAQNLLNDIFDKKVGLEPPINAELEPEQRLNEKKKTITFWTKMTGFVTTISAWLSKPFKKKSVANNVEIKPQEISENDMKEINDLDDIGLLDEYEEEEGLKIEPVNNENLELNRNSKIQEDNKEEDNEIKNEDLKKMEDLKVDKIPEVQKQHLQDVEDNNNLKPKNIEKEKDKTKPNNVENNDISNNKKVVNKEKKDEKVIQNNVEHNENFQKQGEDKEISEKEDINKSTNSNSINESISPNTQINDKGGILEQNKNSKIPEDNKDQKPENIQEDNTKLNNVESLKNKAFSKMETGLGNEEINNIEAKPTNASAIPFRVIFNKNKTDEQKKLDEAQKKVDDEYNQHQNQNPTNIDRIGKAFSNYQFDKDVDEDFENLNAKMILSKINKILNTQNQEVEKEEWEKADEEDRLKEERRIKEKPKNNTTSQNTINDTNNNLGDNQQPERLIFPKTFRDMQNNKYNVTNEMQFQFLQLQAKSSQNSTDKLIKQNAKYQPEYYVNHQLLYEAFIRNPKNILFVKLLNLLKCNDPDTLIEEKAKLEAEYNTCIDPLLLEHLEKRAAKLQALKIVPLPKWRSAICTVRNNHFNLQKKYYQDEKTLNVCWSIALSNLLACQGINILPEYIRATRVDDSQLIYQGQYSQSSVFSQSQRGQFSSVKQGFDQLLSCRKQLSPNQESSLDAIKNYECIEEDYEAYYSIAESKAKEDNKKSPLNPVKEPLTWEKWFIENLKKAFGGTELTHNTASNASAMSISDDNHVITILGYKKNDYPDNPLLYIHDSLNKSKTVTTVVGLKKLICTKHDLDIYSKKQDEQETMQQILLRTGITYLKKKDQDNH